MNKSFAVHYPIGRKIRGVRKIMGISQEELAVKLGMTHQGVSKMEQSDSIDEDRIKDVAKALGVSTDTIENYSEESTINYIQNNFADSNQNATHVFVTNNNCTFNPLDEYKKMVDENKALYNQLIKTEREKVELLTKLLGKK